MSLVFAKKYKILVYSAKPMAEKMRVKYCKISKILLTNEIAEFY